MIFSIYNLVIFPFFNLNLLIVFFIFITLILDYLILSLYFCLFFIFLYYYHFLIKSLSKIHLIYLFQNFIN